MKIEMGESLIYSWLRHTKACQLVQTNWKASPKWHLQHDEELLEWMKATGDFFLDKYGYQIYKQNASLSQLLQQGECDALGVSFRGDSCHFYAVDVAFHRAGLEYGKTRKDTVMNIVKKSLRAAFCLYGYFGVTSGEILFASPKVGASVLRDAVPCFEDVNGFFARHNLSFTARIAANEEFKRAILEPVLSISRSVDDTSELFLRSYQLWQMFEGQ